MTQGPTHSHSPIGAIVGGTVGGVVALLLAVACLILYLRTRTEELPVFEETPVVSEQDDPNPYLVEAWHYPATRQTEPDGPQIQTQHKFARDKRTLAGPAQVTQIPSSSITQPSSSVNPTTSDSSDPPEPENTRLTFAEGRSREELSTTELVGILNERLRRGDVVWNEEESPPVYGTTENVS
jgi:hypothetical protein